MKNKGRKMYMIIIQVIIGIYLIIVLIIAIYIQDSAATNRAYSRRSLSQLPFRSDSWPKTVTQQPQRHNDFMQLRHAVAWQCTWYGFRTHFSTKSCCLSSFLIEMYFYFISYRYRKDNQLNLQNVSMTAKAALKWDNENNN